MDRIAIVGGSASGFCAAQVLRKHGFGGSISIIGAESHLAYERPPLSKQLLAGTWDRSKIFFPRSGTDDLDWTLGRRAIGLDLANREIGIDDGSSVGFDGLVIATGTDPRLLPPEACDPSIGGVFVLRTLDDAELIASRLDGDPKVVVVGGGFIGCEVASTCSKRVSSVTIVDPVPLLMSRALGDQFAGFFAGLQRQGDVNLRLGVGLGRIEADDRGQVNSVVLDDGSRLDADLVVVGIGVAPATGWLKASGIALHERDGGVLCNSKCAVLDTDGKPLENVVAAGDVAWWDHPVFGRPLRVEHWENAMSMGEVAALNLLGDADSRIDHCDIPIFWSDQHGKKIQFVGVHDEGDQVKVVEGSPEEGRFVAVYSKDGIVTGALGVGRAARVIGFRDMIAQSAPVSSVTGGLSTI
ncbi:MAG TPA: FAD/NAD(P)-binding oxidoreductase [Acidimicrobiales bacterium]|nr:FAD/NAD(P)-binding oxidoreductase [Acidimicrobiales bacterium]